MKFPDHIPVEMIYVAIATVGGMARYLSNYTQNGSFSFKFFAASSFASGFSGWIFALLGLSLQMPNQLLYVMAGVGGFFGDQTMKLMLEYFQRKKLN